MKYTIALAGNPNCGKTTLFNVLTGSNQYVGNWAGVTVEKKAGDTTYKGNQLTVVDLPGIYSLSPYTMEEIISRDFVIEGNPDVVLNIIDGTNIERNLYLTLQLMELGHPVIVAVNMMDDVKAKGGSIDCAALSKEFGIPFIPIVARKNENVELLLDQTIALADKKLPYSPNIRYNYETQNAINEILFLLSDLPHLKGAPLQFYAGKLLEGDDKCVEKLKLEPHLCDQINTIARNYEHTAKYGDRETMLADARYKYITGITEKAVVKNEKAGALTTSDKIDRIVTNRILALPIFLCIMLLMFLATFGPIGNILKDGVDWFINDVVANGISWALTQASAPDWTFSLIIDAIIGGVGGILTFLPQIMILFLFLSILEDSGYMARAAFIMDRLLRKLGLNGKSFIPMLMGFGCTTPAVMAARTMENIKDRRMTIMLTPFMSCGARLPIYGLFAGIFFPEQQGLVVFSMYVIGMVVAILCGLVLKHTLFKGESAPFVMELPTYRMPTLKNTLMHLWDKCKGFLIKAGTIIFSMSIVIWLLQNFSLSFQMVSDSSISMFGRFGTLIAPLFAPLGFGTWQASVSLLAGLVAKEAVVSTLTLVYAGSSLVASLAGAFTPLSAFCYMTFCLLYMPCIAAFVSVKREMGSMKWAVGAAAFQTGVAYIISLLIFQIGSIFV